MRRAGAGEGFAVTPFSAGHLLGGALWRLTTRDEEHIVYAAAYHHRKVPQSAELHGPACGPCTTAPSASSSMLCSCREVAVCAEGSRLFLTATCHMRRSAGSPSYQVSIQFRAG